MIRAQAVEQHYAETQHDKVIAQDDGSVVCAKCPWQYPPADVETTLLPPDPPAGVRLLEDAHQHIPACDDGSRYCPVRDYEANPVDVPTDPAPAMGPIEPDPGYPHAEDDCTRCQQDAAELAAELAAETSDPGPEPVEAPEAPPLNLKSRIDNAIEHYAETLDRGEPLDVYALADQIHAVVGAGADWSPREENVELTPAQALAYLLDQPEWARINRLGMLLEQARKGGDCFMRGHQDIEQELREIRQQRDRLHHAMVQIARLTATIDQPESVGQSVIGSIASEALVPE